ncbi:MAG: C25 family cysteine peptidase, partial [Lentimicrobiaceae bacterium]|nr:C25 family cysteine peptidase [Lentimicrobiaceae bacterium]
MKKIFSFFIVLVFVMVNINAQNQQIIVGTNYVYPNEVTLVAERGTSTTIKFNLNELNLIATETDYGIMNKMSSTNAPVILIEGVPELIYLSTAIIIPDVGASELDITYGEYTEIENIEIAPSKGNLPRSIDPATVPYVKGEVYTKDAFFPGNLAVLDEPFIMRDVRGQVLVVYPVQYNPVSKVLRIYSEITVTVNNTRSASVNEFTTQKRHSTIEPEFHGMYNNLFINYSSLSRGYPTGEDGDILVICHTPWVSDMKPYVDWKRTIGRKTTIVPTSAIAPLTAANIKTYISNFYNDPDNNLAYVLLVGDHQQLPPHAVGTVRSDVTYGKLVGNDDYLEILIGRFSAETPAHVQTQVQRSIHYERDLNASDTWLSTGIGVARNEGAGSGHDDGEADHVHMNNIRNRLLANGYTTVWQEYDGGAGVPNTTAAQINSRINAGASLLNYCNHGSPTGWSVAGYSTTNVDQLQNANKLPFIHLVACNNGEFGPWQYNTDNDPCLAEVFMRHTYNGQPAGAIAAFGATISIGWQPPMTAQDEYVNSVLDLPSPYSGAQPGILRTIAGVWLNSSQKMLMQTNYNSAGMSSKLGDYNSWLVFGDPSLMIRSKTPQEMTVSHNNIIFFGMSEFSVTCDAEGALVTMSTVDSDDEVIILGTAVVAGGVANLNLYEPIASPDPLTLAIVGHNKVTYINTDILATPAEGAYVVPGGYTVPDEEKLTYISTNTEIEVTLKNVGVEATGALTVTLSSNDSQLTVVNNTATCGSIAPDGSATVKFNVTVANDIPDNKTFIADITASEGGKASWTSKLPVKAFAPNFSMSKVLIDGAENGNLEKGAVITITTVVENKGGADAFNVIGNLEVGSPYVTLACAEEDRAGQKLSPGETMELTFTVISDPSMPFGHEANFDLLLDAQYGLSFTAPFTATCSGSNNYCMPGNSNCSGYQDRITSLVIVKTNDQSVIHDDPPTCTPTIGYTDYTDVILDLVPGEQYTIKVKVGYQGHRVRGWIDFNGNNVFDDSESLFTIACATVGTEYSANFTIPEDVAPGIQRFRIRTRDGGSVPGACDTYTYGQTLDYSVLFPELFPRVGNVEAVLVSNNITITWEAPEEGTPVGYNIYRNNERLNETLLTVTNFTEENVEEGVYAYNVTAVYEGNKESFAERSNIICNFDPTPKLCEKPIEL